MQWRVPSAGARWWDGWRGFATYGPHARNTGLPGGALSRHSWGPLARDTNPAINEPSGACPPNSPNMEPLVLPSAHRSPAVGVGGGGQQRGTPYPKPGRVLHTPYSAVPCCCNDAYQKLSSPPPRPCPRPASNPPDRPFAVAARGQPNRDGDRSSPAGRASLMQRRWIHGCLDSDGDAAPRTAPSAGCQKNGETLYALVHPYNTGCTFYLMLSPSPGSQLTPGAGESVDDRCRYVTAATPYDGSSYLNVP